MTNDDAIVRLADEYHDNEEHIDILRQRNIDIVLLLRNKYKETLERIGDLIGMTKQGVRKVVAVHGPSKPSFTPAPKPSKLTKGKKARKKSGGKK